MNEMNQYLQLQSNRVNAIPASIEEENEFNRLGVEIFKEICSLIRTVSSGVKVDGNGSEIGYSKEEAVIVGSFIRYGKLCIGFYEQYSKARLETSMIMFRCLAETYVNLKYFLKYADAHTMRHYIKHSLQTEFQVLDILRQNTMDKEILEPIEQRIISSMSKAFDDADFDANQMNNSSKWSSKIKDRLSDILGPDAYALIYGLGSHSIHGNWQDLCWHHLEKRGTVFFPTPDWSTPRLQILSVGTIFSCDILTDYAVKLLPKNDDVNELLKVVEDIFQRASTLDKMHEEFIQNQRNNSTPG